MRWSLFLLEACLSFLVMSQAPTTVKKKHLGTYRGELPAYTLTWGVEQVPVSACPIVVRLGANDFSIQLGEQRYKGTWRISFQTSDYYQLEGFIPGRVVSEQFQLYKQRRILIREGIFTQPNAVLELEEK
jgi:hypothetical protein